MVMKLYSSLSAGAINLSSANCVEIAFIAKFNLKRSIFEAKVVRRFS